jgi:hypothetical protein
MGIMGKNNISERITAVDFKNNVEVKRFGGRGGGIEGVFRVNRPLLERFNPVHIPRRRIGKIFQSERLGRLIIRKNRIKRSHGTSAGGHHQE